MDAKELFAKRLKQARQKAGFSIDALSEKTGKEVSKQTIFKYEAGKTMAGSPVLIIIPNVSFPDGYWENYWLEGWPKHSIIAVSSVGVLTHGDPEGWLKGMERIRKELKPLHILRYGPKIPGESTENCTYFDNDNNRSANGW